MGKKIPGMFLCLGTRLPEKGATTGSIIGAIIGVILIVAIIGTAVAMYRKHRAGKLNGDGPPKHKPPPPKKKNNTAIRPVTTNNAPAAEERLLHEQNYRTQDAEPVTDLDASNDNEVDDNGGDEGARVHYYAAAPSGWDDPGNGEAPPFYERSRNESQEYRQDADVSRGDSFVSSAMFV